MLKKTCIVIVAFHPQWKLNRTFYLIERWKKYLIKVNYRKICKFIFQQFLFYFIYFGMGLHCEKENYLCLICIILRKIYETA